MIFSIVALVGALAVWWVTTRKDSQGTVPNESDEPNSVGTVPSESGGALEFSFLAGQWYMCIRNYYEFEKGQVYQARYQGIITTDVDGQEKSYAVIHPALYFRPATEEEIPSKPGDSHGTVPNESPSESPQYDEYFERLLKDFESIVKVERDTLTYNYLKTLYDEACEQIFRRGSLHGLPLFIKAELFPSLALDGDQGDRDHAAELLISSMMASHLAELLPTKRTALMKTAYESSIFTRYSNVFGWQREFDPNNIRVAASMLYAAMRGTIRPDTEKMREEVGGKRYDRKLSELVSDSRTNVAPDAFFTDLLSFMPTAPGPYAPGYAERTDETYPDEERDAFDNLKTDRDVHEMIVSQYNLGGSFEQAVVQAIADKEGDMHHIFGESRKTEHYTFEPVFGMTVLGCDINPDGPLAALASQMWSAGASARGILQSGNQYGRLRPGCSWSQEALKNSFTDDRRNVLVDIEVEDNDGCKDTPNTFGHYDENGLWVYTKAEADQYAEQQKNLLYANSYPSGHSGGITAVASLLCELFPMSADKIMQRAIQYSLNRNIARYHWTSDVINGRVVGAIQAPVCRAASDYDEMLTQIRDRLTMEQA